ncbi:PA14 domain-containing protein [Candidatus Halobeggiatoa sp. HSG11]|nr:PA14 domain-containing protein [Candidatus Halobeggiatoa sp. HSG11]
MNTHNPPSQPDAHISRSTRLFTLFCTWLLAFWLFPAQAAPPDCPVDGAYATYEESSGKLHIPAIELKNSEQTGVYRVELRLIATSSEFEVVSAVPSNISVSEVRSSYDAATGIAELNGYLLDAAGNIRSFHQAKFTFNPENGRFLVNELTEQPQNISGINAQVYTGNETVFPLVRGGADQFLLPVEIGNQTLNLLVDTGSDALLVFEDRLSDCNRSVRRREDSPIQATDTPVSKSYASGTREGVLATASVRIGTYSHSAMQIMLIRSPDSQNDPSLTAKGADGIIGLRRTAGLNFSSDSALLDAPLTLLTPQINGVEFNLPPAGDATLAFGKQPLLEQANADFIFRAKAKSVADPNDRTQRRRFADMQVPFRAKTSYGEAAGDDLDILFDTGAVSRLVLDTKVAEKLGYNSATEKWMIDENEEIELNLIGLTETTTLHPKFEVWEVSVAPYSMMGVEFEAVLGISRWQEYVVGFDFVPERNGGPDGTISLLRRLDLQTSQNKQVETSSNLMDLPGLNSPGNDEFPVTDNTGNIIVFQSDRDGSVGGTDVYLWQRDSGLVNLAGLNSVANETNPYVSGDGQFVAFVSDRTPNKGLADIYLYDLNQKTLVDLPNLNSEADDTMPVLSGDGRYLAFVSERDGNKNIYLYDRTDATFIDMPNVNSDSAETSPALTKDGSFLSFTRQVPAHQTPNNQANDDIFVYNILNRTMLPLSKGMRGVNTNFNEQHSALNQDTLRLAFHSNRRNPEMGLYNRDIFVVDAITQIPLSFPWLNSEFDDVAPNFSGNGESLVFQSRRLGGEGGADIYQYSFQSQASATATEQVETIPLTQTAEGLFTAPVDVDNQTLNLLIDTTFPALVVFRDTNLNLTDTGKTVSLPLGLGRINGTLATANIKLGIHQANMRIVLAERQDCADALGLSLTGADGIIGSLAGTLNVKGEKPDVPLQMLKPMINLIELNFDANGNAGMSLGQMPLLGKISRSVMQYTMIPSERDPTNPHQSSTDMRVPFVSISYRADGTSVGATGEATSNYNNHRDLPQAIAGTLLQDRVILDTQIATKLGYDAAIQSWPNVNHVNFSLILFGSDTLLPIAENVPVSKIQLADLSKASHAAVIGVDYWNNYVLGMDLNQKMGGIVLIVERQNTQYTTKDVETNTHFIPLLDINSIADELNADISDDGQTIVFQSNRLGDDDIYVWRQGLLELPGLNSPHPDLNPNVSGNGNLVAFESLRNGQPDIFLYDINNGTFIDLPNLNTAFIEEYPTLNAEGTLLAYSSRPDMRNADTYLYDLTTKQPKQFYYSWFNTDANELKPTLNASGSLIAFEGRGRADGKSTPGGGGHEGADVYLYNLNRGRLLDLPNLNSPFIEGNTSLSADGNFLAFYSNRYDPSMLHVGNDVLLMEVSSGELLDLPGLNSDYEDTSPALTEDAEHILFHSKRPGGEGGYDLYLYHRDTEDNTRYFVSNAYMKYGYVIDEIGRPLGDVTVSASDADGNLIGSVVTDSAGNFTLSVPVGPVLPISYTADSGKVVVDEVGDDTYIPDFEAGNLKFTQVWVEDTMQAGMPTKIWFDVETETPKHNTFMKLYLVNLRTGSIDDLNIAGGNFDVAHSLTALTIDKLGHVGLGDTVTKTQDLDTVTEISYLTDDNSKAHVEHSFIVPAGVENGTYAAVFSIGRFDYNPEDDALQSEDAADKQDNFLAAPASVIVGQPDKPNLRILSAELNSNSFELPRKRPVDGGSQFSSELVLNMEVESMAQDTGLPVNIVFALDIDGQSYPLSIADNSGRRPSLVTKKTYPMSCRAETREGYPAGERCASLFKQDQQGYTYKLYIDGAAYDVLAAKTSDSTVNLVIQLDPTKTVTEWENNTADNVKTMPVMFLASQEDVGTTRSTRRSVRAGSSQLSGTWKEEVTDYGIDLFTPLDEAEEYGTDDIGIGYEFQASLTYAEGSVTQSDNTVVNYPYAAAFDGTGNRVYFGIFGYEIDVLSVDVGADINGDKLLCTWFGYDVDVIGLNGWYGYYGTDSRSGCGSGGTEDVDGEYEIFNSQDSLANEYLTKSVSIGGDPNGKKTFVVGIIPVTVEAGATGEVGLRGSLVVDTSNTVTISVGPYLELTAYADGGVTIGIYSAGIGIELLLLGVEVPFTAALQVLPSEPLAIFTFEVPLVISTLDGEFYLWYKGIWDKNKSKYVLLEWEGFEWEYPLIDPVFIYWAQPNQFVLDTTATTGTLPSGINSTTSELNYNLSPTSNFGAEWVGTFDFDAGTYSFEARADDYLTVALDTDGDDNYDATPFGMNESMVVDHAGDNDGTPKNGPTWLDSDVFDDSTVQSNAGSNLSAHVSGSMSFDGNGDYVHLPTNPVSSGTVTIEHWVKPDDIGDDQILVYASNVSGDGFGNSGSYLEVHTAIRGSKAYFNYQDGSNTLGLTGLNTLKVGKWYHIAVTYDTDGLMSLYVDGVYQDSSSGSFANKSASRSYIGRPANDSKTSRYFDGTLDEVRIWNYVRTQTEIQDNMYKQLIGNEVGEEEGEELVAYYRFDASQPNVTQTIDVAFTEDDAINVSVDYENISDDAKVSLAWSKINTFNTSYYNSTDWGVSGDDVAVWTDMEDEIDHDWDEGLPGDDKSGTNEYGITNSTFSAEWEGEFQFDESVTYTFVLTTDDSAAKLYLDGSQLSFSGEDGRTTTVEDSDGNTAYYVYEVSESIDATDNHTIKLQYSHDNSTPIDALVQLEWQAEDQFISTVVGNLGVPATSSQPLIFLDPNGHWNHPDNEVTWVGEFDFASDGYYEFVGRFSGAVDVWVDGSKYLGTYSAKGPKAYYFSPNLTAGYHEIKVVYNTRQRTEPVENIGEHRPFAIANLDWNLRADDVFYTYYYQSSSDMEQDDVTDVDNYLGQFGGIAPRLIERKANVTNNISFTLNNGAYLGEINGVYQPDSDVNNNVKNITGNPNADFVKDGFAVRWMGDISIATDSIYVFTVEASDNVRLWVDNTLMVDELNGDRPVTTYQEAVLMHDTSNGESHAIRMEYADIGGTADGGNAQVTWTEITNPNNTTGHDIFNVQYFNSKDLSGSPVYTTTETSIDHSWGTGSPDGAVNSDSFSTRWVGVFEFEESDYTFTATSDDGVRVYVDGSIVIDAWVNQGPTTYTETLPLEAGLHSIKVEYYENTGGATINVGWVQTSDIAGNALTFDGTDDYVNVPYNEALNPDAFTFEAWAYVTGNSGNWRTVMSNRGSGSEQAANIYAGNDDNWQYWLGNGSAWTKIIGSAIELNTWTHLAGTYDGNTLAFYINGELQGTNTVTQAKNTDMPLTIGAQTDGTSFPFYGNIDEVRVWNTARSQAEIQTYMKSTLKGTESNLVAYYQFDQSTGNTVTDTTGNYDGTFDGDSSPTWGVSDAPLTDLPAPGSALSFDGTGDYVELNNSITNWATSDFSLELWVKTSTVSRDILVKTNGDSNWEAGEKHLRIDSDGSVFFSGWGNSWIDGSTSITDGQWHHIAVVWDYSSGISGTGRLYLDGEDDTDTVSRALYTANKVDNAGDTIKLGLHINASNADKFTGQLDEVRIWDVVRSQAEIQAYMNRTMVSNESGLIAYYNFDEKAGSSIAVLSDIAGSYHGTLNGNPTWIDSDAPVSKMLPPGNAMTFDGVDDYVDLGESAPTLDDTFTQEAWIYPDYSDTVFHGFLGYQSGSRAPSMWVKGQKIHYGFTDDSDTPSWNATTSGDVLTLNAWNHVAVSFDGSDYTLYVNGEQVHNYTGASGKTPVSKPVRWIGRVDNYFPGMIDEVRIWNDVRTQTEIQDNMNTTVSSFENGLVAYYRFDQDSGLEVIDVSSYDNDGVLNDSTGPAWVPSDISTGYTMSFDGDDDYVELNNSVTELANANFSLEAWIKTTASNAMSIIAKNDDDTTWESGEKCFYLNNSGVVNFVGYGNSFIKSTTVVNDGEWHHVSVTWDESSETGHIYIDGTDDTSSSTYNSNNADNSGNTMKIAHPNYSEGYNHFDGEIDEVRVWSTTRSQAEIEDNMDSVLSGSESGLVAYYNFNKIGLTVEDVTGSGNDGTTNDTAIPEPVWLASGAMTGINPPGNALSFDGNGDYVDLGASAPVLGTTFTQETWIYPDYSDADTSFHAFMGYQNGGADDRAPGLWTKGKLLHYGFGDGTNWYGPMTSNDVLTLRAWNHVAVTFDGTDYILYVNGEQVHNHTGTSGKIPVSEPMRELGKGLPGKMDEVRIWTVTRTQTEIQANMNRTLDGDESGLAAYYNFDAVGTTVTDVTGSGNDGTLNGDTDWVVSGADLD